MDPWCRPDKGVINGCICSATERTFCEGVSSCGFVQLVAILGLGFVCTRTYESRHASGGA
jgi:hypothetical protein